MPSNSNLPAQTAPHSSAGATLVEWRPRPTSGPLAGHATVDFGGWVINRIAIFRRADGSLSVGSPSGAEIDSDGRQRERDGKRQFWQVVTFGSAEAKARWERAVLGALSAAGIGGAGGPQ